MHRAYAKINFGLLVLDKRPDGYHNIATVFHRIDLFDVVKLVRSSRIEVISLSGEAPQGEKNVCYKAATLLREHVGTNAGVKIELHKNVPAGAGLGGGSADAAVVLQELPRFWDKAIDEKTLNTLALQLGSDVPFFLGKGSALGTGRGEILTHFELDIPYTILLCYPNIHISTGWAYQHVKPANSKLDLRSLVLEGMKEPMKLVNGLRNDFEPVVFRTHPEVMRVKEAMMRSGAEFASMSGSGSSVYGLFSRKDFATEAATYLQQRGFQTFLTSPDFTV
ncbi:MAG: 4-(cytidine 5'-diphospho)-2-C-methyl-D-erythritol kinase [Ignavibacteriae bacterium]|nr:4-(cytidine 5'-diphospho)-2-C-methyl-D-erythritol kinase [Ignavibacteriota bacterium]